MKQIKITVDTNDADYTTEISKISEEDLKMILPLVEAIKNFKKGHQNYPYSEYSEKTPKDLYPTIDKDVFSIFEEYCPYLQDGFHSVTSIEIYEMTLLEKLI